MDDLQYNEKICITAGELRDRGISVPESVPDCGWIPRWSMRLSMPENSVTDEGQGAMSIKLAVEFQEPFRWLEGSYTIDNK